MPGGPSWPLSCCWRWWPPTTWTPTSGSILPSAASTTFTQPRTGSSHKIVAASPAPELSSTAAPGTVPVLSLDFAYVCLKNADSVLPQVKVKSALTKSYAYNNCR